MRKPIRVVGNVRDWLSHNWSWIPACMHLIICAPFLNVRCTFWFPKPGVLLSTFASSSQEVHILDSSV